MRLSGEEADARRAQTSSDADPASRYKGDFPIGMNDDYAHAWIETRYGETALTLEVNGTERQEWAKPGEPFPTICLLFDWESLDHLIATLRHYQRVIERAEATPGAVDVRRRDG